MLMSISIIRVGVMLMFIFLIRLGASLLRTKKTGIGLSKSM